MVPSPTVPASMLMVIEPATCGPASSPLYRVNAGSVVVYSSSSVALISMVLAPSASSRRYARIPAAGSPWQESRSPFPVTVRAAAPRLFP